MEYCWNNMEKVASSFFEEGEKIVVGVSGGADSMALLNCLFNSSKSFNITVAHLNHMIRGKESERDEEFVRSFCVNKNISFVSRRENIKELAKKKGMSVEECGRERRYKFFREFGAKIATAHTLSDVIETFFLNILRGCGLKGLISIPKIREDIYRPILQFTRRDTELYCKENGIEFVNDSTNFEEGYLRNRLRLRVIPEIKKINYSFEKKFLYMIDAIKKDEEYLNGVANYEFKNVFFDNGMLVNKFNKLDISIKVRVLEKFLKLNNINNINRKLLYSIIYICELGVGKKNLPKNVTAIIKKGVLYIEEPHIFEPFKILFPKTIEFFYKKLYFIRCSVTNYNYFINKSNYLFLFKFDCDKISGDAYIRSREKNDRIKLFKRPTKTLKSLIQEKRLSKKKKDELILMADEIGVFWVYGFGADIRVIPDIYSKNLCLVFEMID